MPSRTATLVYEALRQKLANELRIGPDPAPETRAERATPSLPLDVPRQYLLEALPYLVSQRASGWKRIRELMDALEADYADELAANQRVHGGK